MRYFPLILETEGIKVRYQSRHFRICGDQGVISFPPFYNLWVSRCDILPVILESEGIKVKYLSRHFRIWGYQGVISFPPFYNLMLSRCDIFPVILESEGINVKYLTRHFRIWGCQGVISFTTLYNKSLQDIIGQRQRQSLEILIYFFVSVYIVFRLLLYNTYECQFASILKRK